MSDSSMRDRHFVANIKDSGTWLEVREGSGGTAVATLNEQTERHKLRHRAPRKRPRQLSTIDPSLGRGKGRRLPDDLVGGGDLRAYSEAHA